MPDDPAIHRCALAYASDITILDTALLPHQRSIFDRDIMGASLDHAVWFHRPFRADEWLLYAQDSPSAQGGRGLTRGLIFKPDGTSTWSEPGWVKGVTFLTDLYKNGYAPKDSVNWGFNEIVAGFYSGSCAMLDQDPDALIAIAQRMDAKDFAVAPMPVGPYILWPEKA